jgi:hypothetical protein
MSQLVLIVVSVSTVPDSLPCFLLDFWQLKMGGCGLWLIVLTHDPPWNRSQLVEHHQPCVDHDENLDLQQ